MKTNRNAITAFLIVIAIVCLVASVAYAKANHLAPSGSAMEIVTVLPSLTFCVGGLASLIAAVSVQFVKFDDQ